MRISRSDQGLFQVAKHLGWLIAAVIFTWASAIPGEFVWIDRGEIVEGGYRVTSFNDFIDCWSMSLDQYLDRNTGGLEAAGGYLRPVYAMSISLDWWLWSNRPWLYHLENIAWHLIVVVSLYYLGKELLRDLESGSSIAFWGSLIFAIHPLGVHSTTWISGRKDLLATAFAVLALLALQRSITSTKVRSLAVMASIFQLLALFSKELAFVVPVIGTIFVVARPMNRGRSMIVLVSLWLVTIAAMLYRVSVLRVVGLGDPYPDLPWWGYLGTCARLWWTYMGRVVWPWDPTIVDRWRLSYELAFVDWIGIIAILGLIGIACFGLRRRWQAIPLFLWYVVWLLPASGIFPLRHLYAERYLYPATWGLIVVLVYGLFSVLHSRYAKFRTAVLASICFSLSLETATENRFWWSDQRLFARALAQEADYVEGWMGLASLALEAGDYRQAVDDTQRGLAAIDRDHASYYSPFIAYANLGLASMRLGQYDEAQSAFSRALEARPGNRFAQSNLGFALLKCGKFEEAVRVLEPVVAADASDELNVSNLASALLVLGRFKEAAEHFDNLTREHPKVAIYMAKLAWAEAKLGKHDEARRHIDAAVRLSPDDSAIRGIQQLVLKAR